MKALVTRSRNQRGMVTAEYAAGTLAAVSFGGVLLKIITDPQLREHLMQIIMRIFSIIFGG